MAVILSLSANIPAIAIWRPLYLLLTVLIVFSQKVDTTLSKGILRIVATFVGGAYGEPVFAAASSDCYKGHVPELYVQSAQAYAVH